MKSQDIRKKFQDYFVKQGHTWVSSSSLIPQRDSSLLFTNAGMNQFKDCFLGIKEPPAPQVCSIQKCLRAGGKHNDLEEVGNSPYHHTFFEMIGSFSFGSYFKKEAIDHAISFLTKELGLPKDRLWVSVFKEDKESAEIWIKKQKIPLEKIFFLGEKDNFWRMGNTGPCGPCSEIYYYDGTKPQPTPEDMTEIWNLVFMEFNEDHSGRKTPLPKPCIDTGMGLERLSTILQRENSNYHTDLFKGIIQALEKASGIKYDFTQNSLTEEQIAFRVIADHSRAISFLICDGVLPGSDGASYVLRRILRRALFYSQKLHSPKNLLCIAVQQLINGMKDVYPLEQEKELIQSSIKEEASLFTENLKSGKSIFLQKIKNLMDKTIPDETIWDLYSTYGFPPDLTRLIAQEKGFIVSEDFNLEEFKQEQNQKENYEDQWFRLKIYLVDIAQKYKIKKTPFTGYEKSKEESNILPIPYVKDSLLPSELFADPEERKTIGVKNLELVFLPYIEKDKTGWIITNKTCFYPEGGGPKGDKGIIETKSGNAQVLDCKKQGNFIFHLVKVLDGKLHSGESCTLEVDSDHRRLIATSHSATHLLHHALREVLGKSVRQKGSLVEPGKLRFDFSYPKPLNPDQLKTIENKVTKYIQNKHSVSYATYPYQEAIKKGALSLAGENYEKKVRVIQMGDSIELCGGIHVKNTSEIGEFKIISETGVQSGVRRITAYTSDLTQKYFTLLESQIKTLREHLEKEKIPLSEKEGGNPFIYYMQEKEDEIKNLKKKLKTFALNTNPNKKINIKEQSSSDLQISPKNSTQNIYIQQNEELRKYLKLSLPKDLEERKDIFISFIQKKEDEKKSLKKQIENITDSTSLKELIDKAKTFSYKNIKGDLLTVMLPIEDRKILAETADQLKSKMKNPAVVIVLGQGETQYPLVITISKELQAHLSGGDILKNTIAPFLEGKGGGQVRFAQGTIKNKDRFMDLETLLLDSLLKED